jgi:hypothetical protein
MVDLCNWHSVFFVSSNEGVIAELRLPQLERAGSFRTESSWIEYIMNDADAAPMQAGCEGIDDEGREDEWGKIQFPGPGLRIHFLLS